MTKQDVIEQCHRYPDKIFHILKKDGFAGAKVLWARDKDCLLPINPYTGKAENFLGHLQQLALEPDELSYVERFAGEVEG